MIIVAVKFVMKRKSSKWPLDEKKGRGTFVMKMGNNNEKCGWKLTYFLTFFLFFFLLEGIGTKESEEACLYLGNTKRAWSIDLMGRSRSLIGIALANTELEPSFCSPSNETRDERAKGKKDFLQPFPFVCSRAKAESCKRVS